jgi:seryl-tRNA synthetase
VTTIGQQIAAGKADARTSEGGFATLGPRATRLQARLDGVFASWAAAAGAIEITLPPVQPVADLASLDVFRNFPHMAWVATNLAPEVAAERDGLTDQVPAESLRAAQVGLPPAVCYGVYLYFREQAISQSTLVTAIGTCFRREEKYDGLRRLGAFRMREIVALGSPEHAREHLKKITEQLTRFAEALDLPLSREAASDPFFDSNGAQAQWQRLAPVKHEYRYGDLAISSLNEHRKFFGQRCGIRDEAGAVVSTSCVGFGLERWIHALTDRYAADWDAIHAAIDKASEAVD